MASLTTIKNAVSEVTGRIGDTTGINKTTIEDNDPGQSRYEFKHLTFPGNVGNDDVGHYMIININVPVNRSGEKRGIITNSGDVLKGEYSKVDVLRFGGNPSYNNSANNLSDAVQREPFSIPRYTRRIVQSIALFMPSTLVYSTQNAYEDISLTALGGSIVGGALGALAGPLGRGIASAVGSNITTASRVVGYPINPRVEILYSQTPQRQFVFEVLMAPRNLEESENMENIIRTIRLHAAPELDPITSGLTFIPPAEFDITFFNKGNENTKLPRINTCVLERIDVDYSPTGVFSTFHNGHPVICRLSLGFREIEILHKLRVAQGF